VAALGIDEAPKVALVALGTFFIVEHHVAEAIRGTDSHLVELVKVLGKTPGEMISTLFLPAALPALFVALRLALALGWTLLLTARSSPPRRAWAGCCGTRATSGAPTR
jgi:sulfonate transport system permease protein